jgi:hypothetical protein
MKVTCTVVINISEQRIKDRQGTANRFLPEEVGDIDRRTHLFEMNYDVIGYNLGLPSLPLRDNGYLLEKATLNRKTWPKLLTNSSRTNSF